LAAVLVEVELLLFLLATDALCGQFAQDFAELFVV
jgi:hypothetical protein